MKLSPLAITLSLSSAWIGFVRSDLSFLGDDDYFLLANHAGGVTDEDICNADTDKMFCAQTENAGNTSGTYVVIDKCNFESTGGWRLWTAEQNVEDENEKGFLLILGTGFSGDPDALCMQAEDGDERSRIRVRPCDINHALQRWVWQDYGPDDFCDANDNNPTGGVIKLEINQYLCLTWNGAANLDPAGETRRMIVMPCAEIGDAARPKGWMAL